MKQFKTNLLPQIKVNLEFADIDIKVESWYDIEQVVAEVSGICSKSWMIWM